MQFLTFHSLSLFLSFYIFLFLAPSSLQSASPIILILSVRRVSFFSPIIFDLILRSNFVHLFYFLSKTDFLFQEAFLTTYRTFISPKMLIEKLVYRFNKFIMMEPMNHGPCPYSVNGKRLSGYSFSSSSNHYGSTDSLYHPSLHQKAARAASSLIARVVNDLW